MYLFSNFNNFIHTYKEDSSYTVKAYLAEHINTCLSLGISQFLHLAFMFRQVAVQDLSAPSQFCCVLKFCD